LADGGKTVLLTTNVMSEADYLCDRVLIIDRGAHVVAGSPEDLKRRLGQREIVVALDADDAAAALRGAIPLESRQQGSTLTITAPHGAEDLVAVTRALSDSSQVNSIELKKPRLDDVFLHFTGRSLRD
jgi:ABC-2 type transport system ATP-binding protein